jgi:uncharacterized protein with FMN-binding domain
MTRSGKFVLAAAVAAAALSAGTTAPVYADNTPAAGQAGAAPVAAHALRDGTFGGPRVKVVHGYLQVDAVVSGGALTDVRIREFPGQDPASRRLNTPVLDHLIKSAVAKGSAEVDGVSGATMTSKAFVKSLGEALAGAAK